MYRGSIVQRRSAHGGYAMHDSEARQLIKQTIRAIRHSLTPESVGLPTWPKRRMGHVRQTEMDLLCRIPGRWYPRLERGQLMHPDAEFLRRFAATTGLDLYRTYDVHRISDGRPPPRPKEIPVKLSPEAVVYIRGAGLAPTFGTDHAFNILDANAAAHEWLGLADNGGHEKVNLALAMLAPSAAARFDDVSELSTRVVDHLKVARVRYGSDPVLGAVLDHVKSLDVGRDLWSRPLAAQPRGLFTVQVKHPLLGERTFVALEAEQPDGTWMFEFHWVNGELSNG